MPPVAPSGRMSRIVAFQAPPVPVFWTSMSKSPHAPRLIVAGPDFVTTSTGALGDTVTVWSSSWSTTAGVPFVKVRLDDVRLELLLSALNHWIAPATLVSVTPLWVLASSLVR